MTLKELKKLLETYDKSFDDTEIKFVGKPVKLQLNLVGYNKDEESFELLLDNTEEFEKLKIPAFKSFH